jgi:hypothetical protein
MKTQAVPIWLALVGCLVLGNLAAALTYWSVRDAGRSATDAPSPVDSGAAAIMRDFPDIPGRLPKPVVDAMDSIADKLPGDVLFVVLDTRYFRQHGDEWAEQLTTIQTDLAGRMFGNSMQLVDRKTNRPWNPARPLPAGEDVFADDDVEDAFAQAFAVVEEFGRRARWPRAFKTFVVWMSDVNPDVPPRKQVQVRPQKWLMLLWHGRPEPSRRLTELFGDDSIVRFKQDTTGLRNTINFYVDRPIKQ